MFRDNNACKGAFIACAERLNNDCTIILCDLCILNIWYVVSKKRGYIIYILFNFCRIIYGIR